MAIVNADVSTADTTLLTVPASKKYALTTLLVCNTGTDDGTGGNDSVFDCHIVPSGQSKTDTNLILNNLEVAAADTFTFATERLILEEGDRVILVGAAPANLVATLSYLEV